jgi:hypothetical protein
LFLFSLFLFLPIRQLIEEKESLYVLFSMENYYYTLNEYFFLFDGLYFFLLALPSSIHLKILTKFYSIYFKIPHKISAQSDDRIENYIQ